MGDGSHDRISELPDPVIGRILSLMPAKAATQTTILSRRWRGLWEYIWCAATTLDFTAEFAARQTPDEFVRNVNRYLRLHRGKKVQRLLVSLAPDPRFFSDIERWVEFVVARDVEELRLEISSDGYFVGDLEGWVSDFGVPHQVFGCMSLTILGLSNCSLPRSPDFGRLRSLRCLSLTRVDVTDDVLRSILSKCHLLERLLLRECVHFSSIKLRSPDTRLKQLVLVDCWQLYDLEISSPSLQSFHFSGEITFEQSFSDVSGLADVVICSIDRTNSEPHQNYIKLLSDLAHVEILTVCTATLMCVTIWSEYFPEDVPVPLQNLQELQLLIDYMSLEYLSYVYGFFQLCPSPSLERLFVRLPQIAKDSYAMETDVEQHPDVHFNQLRVIKMHNFKGTTCEMKLVGFLLEKTPILESLVLVAPPKSSTVEGLGDGQGGCSQGLKYIEKMDTMILQGQLQALPRKSWSVQIVICEYLEDDTNIGPTHNEHTCEWMMLF